MTISMFSYLAVCATDVGYLLWMLVIMKTSRLGNNPFLKLCLKWALSKGGQLCYNDLTLSRQRSVLDIA